MAMNINEVATSTKRYADKLAAERARRDRIYKIFKEIKAELGCGITGFLAYVQNTYGIEPVKKDGYITSEFIIINEQKYLLFRIKYGI